MNELASRARYSTDLVRHLVGREFHLRYRQSVFGWLWALAEPLARLAVLSFLFTRVLPLDIPNYPVFLFTGIMGWAWFSAGVSSATASAVDRRELLFRPGVPRTAPPIVSVLTDGLDYLAALPVLALFLLFTTGIPLTAVLLPIVLAVQLLLTLGIGFALCTANVHVRDVRHAVAVVLMVGFYATPILYHRQLVPEQFQLLVDLNPMTHLIAFQRTVLIAGDLPNPLTFLAVAVVCALVFVGGLGVYRRSSPTFVDDL